MAMVTTIAVEMMAVLVVAVVLLMGRVVMLVVTVIIVVVIVINLMLVTMMMVVAVSPNRDTPIQEVTEFSSSQNIKLFNHALYCFIPKLCTEIQCSK